MLDAKGIQRVASDNFVVVSGFELGPWQIRCSVLERGSCMLKGKEIRLWVAF